MPFALLRGRGFGVMNMINLIYGGAVIGFAALVPLYAQERYRIAALGAGTLLTARAVGHDLGGQPGRVHHAPDRVPAADDGSASPSWPPGSA